MSCFHYKEELDPRCTISEDGKHIYVPLDVMGDIKKDKYLYDYVPSIYFEDPKDKISIEYETAEGKSLTVPAKQFQYDNALEYDFKYKIKEDGTLAITGAGKYLTGYIDGILADIEDDLTNEIEDYYAYNYEHYHINNIEEKEDELADVEWQAIKKVHDVMGDSDYRGGAIVFPHGLSITDENGIIRKVSEISYFDATAFPYVYVEEGIKITGCIELNPRDRTAIYLGEFVEESAFYGWRKPQSFYYSGYDGIETAIIPNGYDVDYSFWNVDTSDLTTIVFPEKLGKPSGNIFSCCSTEKLSNLYIPNSWINDEGKTDGWLKENFAGFERMFPNNFFARQDVNIFVYDSQSINKELIKLENMNIVGVYNAPGFASKFLAQNQSGGDPTSL